MGAAVSDLESKAVLFAAGASGSVLSFRFVPGMSKRQKVLAVGSGAMMSVFLSPIVALWLAVEANAEAVSGIGFGIGIFGLAICDSIFKKIKSGEWLNIIRPGQ